MEHRAIESFPVLLTPPSFEEDREMGLPARDENIFARIIRDPTNPAVRPAALMMIGDTHWDENAAD